MAVRGVEGTRKASTPGTAVFPDLAERLDDQGILADPLQDGRKLAGLDHLRELRRFLEALGEEGGIRDDLGALELADEVRAQLRSLGGGLADETERNLRRRNGEQTEAHQRAPRQAMTLRPRDFLVFAHGISFTSLGWIASSTPEGDRSHPKGPSPNSVKPRTWAQRALGPPARRGRQTARS